VAAYRPRPVKTPAGSFLQGFRGRAAARVKAEKSVKVKKEHIKKEVLVKKERDEPEPSVRVAAGKTTSKPAPKAPKLPTLKVKKESINGLAESVLEAMASGQKITVVTKYGLRHTCTIIDTTKDQVKFHYESFGDQYDEWLPKTSDRIVEVLERVEVDKPAARSPRPSVLQQLAKPPAPETEELAPRSPGPSEEKKEDCRLLLAMAHSTSSQAPEFTGVNVEESFVQEVDSDDIADGSEPEIIGVDVEDSCSRDLDSKALADDSKECSLPIAQPVNSVVSGIDAE